MINAAHLTEFLSAAGYSAVEVQRDTFLCEAGNTVLTWSVNGEIVEAIDAAIIFKPKSLAEVSDYVARGNPQ